MIQRCTNENDAGYKNYGGRGIRVCERWRKFENFLHDMGEAPEGLFIERVKNDLGYCPENCVWADRASQNRNTRTNRWIEFNGERLTLSDWCRRLNIQTGALLYRLRRWPIEIALTTPCLKSWSTKSVHEKYFLPKRIGDDTAICDTTPAG